MAIANVRDVRKKVSECREANDDGKGSLSFKCGGKKWVKFRKRKEKKLSFFSPSKL